MSRPEQRVRDEQLRLEELELQHRCCVCETNYKTKRVSEHDWERLSAHFNKPIRGFMCEVCLGVAGMGDQANASRAAKGASGEILTPLPMELKNAAAAVFCSSCGQRRSTVIHMETPALLCSQCGDETCKSLSAKFGAGDHYTIQKAMKAKKKYVPAEKSTTPVVPETQQVAEAIPQQAPAVVPAVVPAAAPATHDFFASQAPAVSATPAAAPPAPAKNNIDDLFSAPVTQVAFAPPQSGGFSAFNNFNNQPPAPQPPSTTDFFSAPAPTNANNNGWGNAFSTPAAPQQQNMFGNVAPPPQQQQQQQQHDFFSSVPVVASNPPSAQHGQQQAHRTAADIERDPTLTQMQKATMIQELARQGRGKPTDSKDIFASLF